MSPTNLLGWLLIVLGAAGMTFVTITSSLFGWKRAMALGLASYAIGWFIALALGAFKS